MKTVSKNSSLRIWLAIVGTATLIIGAAYTMVQQSTRLSANDAPIAKAQQVKAELASGAAPTDVVPSLKVNLQNDINVFVIVTDKNQNVLASSALLNGKTPLPPAGIFGYAKIHGSDTLTWQPSDNVRIASHTKTYNDGFIITGQSLDPAEERINRYGLIALAAWLTVILWTTAVLLLVKR